MLKLLTIRNFRNLTIPKLRLSPGPTVIVGKNGQGKTSILEAIYLLSYGKPFRGTKSNVINWHAREAQVLGETDNDNFAISISRDNETKVIINGKTKRIVSLFGKLVTVIFHPEEIGLVTGPPTLRRSWLDRLISTVDKEYLFNLANYQRSLKNRNKLLKTRGHIDEDLEVWDKNLAVYGTKLWERREEIVKVFNQIFKRRATKVIGKPFKIDYTNPLLKEKERRREIFLKKLKETKPVENKLFVTIFGPHRDDFNLFSEETSGQNILDKDVALFGSRAEQRQAAIILKLAEAEFFTQVYKKYPTILLDDVTSELDSENKKLLLSNTHARQVIITTTNEKEAVSGLPSRPNVLKIESGKINHP